MLSAGDMTRLLVRQAGPADLERIHAITQKAYAEQRGQIEPEAGVFRESLEDLRGRLESGWVFLIAEQEGRPVGAVRLTRREGDLYIGRLAVIPACRKAGIGRALMAAAEAWGAAWGLPAARVGAREDVPLNRPYYEALGYTALQRAALRSAPDRYYHVMRKELQQCDERPGAQALTGETYERYAIRYANRPSSRSSWLADALAHFREVAPPPALIGDIGCGPGNELRRLQQSGYQAVGLDRTSAMLDLAGDTSACLLRGDLRSLPLAAGVLDGVVAIASLLHLPRVEMWVAVHELRRVARPGGGLLLLLKMGGGEEWRPTEAGPRFFAFYQPGEVRRLLAGAGFEVVRQWVQAPPVGLADVWVATVARAV